MRNLLVSTEGFLPRRTSTAKDKTESDGELLNGSAERPTDADGDAVVEDVLLKLESSVLVIQ
jgi:hypothetical protein